MHPLNLAADERVEEAVLAVPARRCAHVQRPELVAQLRGTEAAREQLQLLRRRGANLVEAPQAGERQRRAPVQHHERVCGSLYRLLQRAPAVQVAALRGVLVHREDVQPDEGLDRHRVGEKVAHRRHQQCERARLRRLARVAGAPGVADEGGGGTHRRRGQPVCQAGAPG